MKFNTVNSQKLNFTTYQNAFLAFHSYHYQRAVNYLTKWLIYLGKPYQSNLDKYFNNVKYKIQRRQDIGISLKIFWYHFNKLPSAVAQNITEESFQNAKAMILKPQKQFHHNFEMKEFIISKGGFKIDENLKLTLVRSRISKQLFSENVEFQISENVLDHVKESSDKFFLRFRFSQGKWFLDFVKQFQLTYEKIQKDKDLNFASIDIGLNNICLIDEIRLQPILFDLKELFYKVLKLFRKYSKVQEKNQLLKARRYKQKISNFFKNQLKLYAIRIIEYLKELGINRLSVGNVKKFMKRGILNKYVRKLWNMIPFSYFTNYLKFHGSKNSIFVYEIGEAYTSKCSSIDLEEIQKQKEYKGKRINRGLFKTLENIVIHSDTNGALNILRRTIKSRMKKPEFVQAFEEKIRSSIRAISNSIRISFKQLNRLKISFVLLLIKSKDYGRSTFLKVRNLVMGYYPQSFKNNSQPGKEQLFAGMHSNIKLEFMSLY